MVLVRGTLTTLTPHQLSQVDTQRGGVNYGTIDNQSREKIDLWNKIHKGQCIKYTIISSTTICLSVYSLISSFSFKSQPCHFNVREPALKLSLSYCRLFANLKEGPIQILATFQYVSSADLNKLFHFNSWEAVSSFLSRTSNTMSAFWRVAGLK